MGILAAGENTRAISFGQSTDMLVINQTATGISLQKNERNFSFPASAESIIEHFSDYAKLILPAAENNAVWLVKSTVNCLSHYFS